MKPRHFADNTASLHFINLVKTVSTPYRVLEIKELVKECVHQREIEFQIEPAPSDAKPEESAAGFIKRCACVDASAFSPLRRLLSKRRQEQEDTGVVIMQTDEFGTLEKIQVGIGQRVAFKSSSEAKLEEVNGIVFLRLCLYTTHKLLLA